MLRLNREPCACWSQAHNDRKPTLLATSLVSRLEIFCLRLSATASSTVARPRLLVAGWLPEVDTAPFVKRGFAFNQEPYATGKHAGKQGGLGFKMLKTDADRAKALAKPAMPSDSPAAPPPTAVTAQGKRKRSVAEEDGAAAAAPSSAAGSSKFGGAWPVRKPSSSNTAAEEAGAAAQPAQGAAHGEASAGGEAQEEQGQTVPDADEVGEAAAEYQCQQREADGAPPPSQPRPRSPALHSPALAAPPSHTHPHTPILAHPSLHTSIRRLPQASGEARNPSLART